MHPREQKDVIIDIVPATIHPIIEIPELLRLIGSNLTTIEQKTCMLVCKKWYDLFLAFFWHHLDYSLNGIPNLDRHGHLVRSLKIFDVDKDHVSAIAGACHLVQKAKIIVPRVVIWNYLGILAGNLRFIQDLTLHSLSYLRNDHLVAITQLPRIRKLHLGRAHNDQFARLCMGKLLNALDDMPTLSSLRIDGVMLCHDEANPPRSRPTQDVLDIHYYSPGESLWARIRRFGAANRPEMNTNQQTEPWRKFETDPLEPRSAWSNKIDLTRPPDLSATLSKLTSLYVLVHWSRSVRALSTIATQPGSENSVKDSNIDQYHLGHLFMKACNLTELYLDFGHVHINHRETCLSAVTENCLQLEKLTLAGLTASSGPSRSSVKHFFSQIRPTLRRLLLIECVDMTEALMAVPAKTTTSLLELSLVSTNVSQWTIHQILSRCHALQTLTWVKNPPLKNIFIPPQGLEELAPPPSNIKPPPEPVFSVLVEPWPFGSTIQHIEQYGCVEDQEDCETFFRRVERMDRVISFGTSVNDIRKALFENCEEAPPNIAQISHHFTPTLGVVFIPYAANRGIYEVSKDHGWAGNIKEEIKNGWCFRTIQELTLTTTSIHRVHGHTLLSRALTVRELGELLRVFPRLRKIRYKGSRYPLTDMARQLLEQQGGRHILVVHETQAPSCP